MPIQTSLPDASNVDAVLSAVTLEKGSHSRPEDGMCIVELAAYLAHAPHSDHPACVSPVIGAFMRRWNDDLDDETRQRLKPYAQQIIETVATPDIENARAWLVTDWMVRVHTPAWLDLAGLNEQAASLRSLPELTTQTISTAKSPLVDARKKADAAWAAAGDAAWDAAGAAARDAAWDAAWDAARAAAWAAAGDAAWAAAGAAVRAAAWAAAWAAAGDAARDAAGDAAGDAARAAARAAAGDKLKPTVVSLQASAFDLLDRLIAMAPRETK